MKINHIVQLPLAQCHSARWAVGMVVGCKTQLGLCPELALLWAAPLLPLLEQQNSNLNSLLHQVGGCSMGMPRGLATQDTTVGLPWSYTRLFVGPEPRYSPFLALLTLQQPPVECSSRFQGSLLTGPVHFIPPFSWILLLADGDSGLKQIYFIWILSCSLCSSCILSIKPVLLQFPSRKMRSHGKDNQT